MNVLKKYSIYHFADRIGISMKRLRANEKRCFEYQRKQQKNRVGAIVRKKVIVFLEEDIKSKTMPGKKDFITKKGLKNKNEFFQTV